MKEKTTSIAVCVICLLLCIANITTVAINKRQEGKIQSIEKKIEEIRAENVDYVSQVENLEKQLNKLEDEITGIKESTDQIAKQLIEVEAREEQEVKQSIEDEKQDIDEIAPKEVVVTEEITEEPVTEEVTVEKVVINTEEPTTEEGTTEVVDTDIPWVVYEVVECEVHGGDKESKMHVAHVIRNRVWSDLFPDDYYTVCTSPYQFCTRSDVEQSTIDAVNEAMATADTTGGALFFHSMEWMSSWGGYAYIFTDNVGHHFYG